MNQHNLLLTAADTLFFRDGRPFTMGEDLSAEMMPFPPAPSVLFGAVCSAFLSQNPTILNSLQFKNIWLKDSGNAMLLPLPKDLVVPKNADKQAYKAELLQLEPKPTFSSMDDADSHFLVRAKGKNEKVEEGSFLITAFGLKNYLTEPRQKTPFSCLDLSNYLTKETKLGIGRNNDTRISTDGLLYRTGLQRPEVWSGKTLSIAIQVAGLPETVAATAIQLGGEKKIGWLSINQHSLDIKLPYLTSCQFKIYLSTPALFKEGWYPKTFFQNLGLKLLTVVMDKPLNIGGWDVANGQPKPMLKAVPAGTVYYVEATTIEMARDAAKKIHGEAISDYEYRYKSVVLDSRKQGFGIAFIGNI
ncbi:MAG: hypothetical protein RIS64_1935 [Bacteroidota bacterium]|jgi:CRISPR-associated protein Cmr3